MVLWVLLVLLLCALVPRYPTPTVVQGFITPEERAHIMKQAKSSIEKKI